MELVTSLLQGAVESIVPLVVLLGLLIFVHESGHFLIAKYNKVRVEVFSLGFGPKLLKFKRGDTVYAISAIPLGGYVKMFGDDPTSTAAVSPEDQAVSFTHKTVGQRFAIVLAGPIMNFLFAIILFAAIAMMGEQALSPVVGDVEQKSAAFAQGFRSGDQVKTVGGEPVKTWDELQSKLQASGDRTVAVEVLRGEGSAAAASTLEVTPKLEANKNPLSWDRSIGDIEGLSVSSKSSFVGVMDPQSPAAKAGLKSGDRIIKLNGAPITKWRELLAAIAVASAPVSLEVERGLLNEATQEHPEIVKVDLPAPASKDGAQALASFGIEYPQLYLGGTEKGSPAAKAGLLPGDRLVSIDGTKVETFEQVAGTIRAYGDKIPKDVQASNGGFLSGLMKRSEGSQAPPLNIVISRDGSEKTIALAPNVKKRMNSSGNEERRYEIGISPLIVDAQPAITTLDYSNPVSVVGRGIEQTAKWTSLTFLSFVRLFQGEVSPKNVGGFFSIGAMAKKSWQIGAPQFLHVMAIISINLFVLNLLPVPVLDGGHLVFLTVEAIKGAPVSMRKMEIAQQVGLVLLLGLMVFALFNDASRFLN